jgi:hypothetical protein
VGLVVGGAAVRNVRVRFPLSVALRSLKFHPANGRTTERPFSGSVQVTGSVARMPVGPQRCRHQWHAVRRACPVTERCPQPAALWSARSPPSSRLSPSIPAACNKRWLFETEESSRAHTALPRMATPFTGCPMTHLPPEVAMTSVMMRVTPADFDSWRGLPTNPAAGLVEGSP